MTFAENGPRLECHPRECKMSHEDAMEGLKNALKLFLRKRVRDHPPTVGYLTPTATQYATVAQPVRRPA